MRVLAIGAHPDDVEFGCGATLTKMIARGAEVTIACVTAGEQGTSSAEERPKLAATRREEASTAGRVLGVKDVRFLGLPDGLTAFSLADKVAVIRCIRDVRPDVLFVHAKADPFPDHAVVHALVMAAVVGAAGPWYADAGESPHFVPRVLGFEVWHPITEPALVVPCGDSFAVKQRALASHASQTKTVDYVPAAEGLARYRGVMAGTGGPAEAFEVLRCSGAAFGIE